MSTINIGFSLPPHASQDVEDVRKAVEVVRKDFVERLRKSDAAGLIEVEPVQMRSAELNELFVTIQSGAATVTAVSQAALTILLVCRQIRELYKDVTIRVESPKLYKPEDIDKIDQKIAEKLLKK